MRQDPGKRVHSKETATQRQTSLEGDRTSARDFTRRRPQPSERLHSKETVPQRETSHEGDRNPVRDFTRRRPHPGESHRNATVDRVGVRARACSQGQLLIVGAWGTNRELCAVFRCGFPALASSRDARASGAVVRAGNMAPAANECVRRVTGCAAAGDDGPRSALAAPPRATGDDAAVDDSGVGCVCGRALQLLLHRGLTADARGRFRALVRAALYDGGAAAAARSATSMSAALARLAAGSPLHALNRFGYHVRTGDQSMAAATARRDPSDGDARSGGRSPRSVGSTAALAFAEPCLPAPYLASLGVDGVFLASDSLAFKRGFNGSHGVRLNLTFFDNPAQHFKDGAAAREERAPRSRGRAAGAGGGGDDDGASSWDRWFARGEVDDAARWMTYFDFFILSRTRFLVGVPQVTTYTWAAGLLGGRRPIYKCGDVSSPSAVPSTQRNIEFGPAVQSTLAHIERATIAALQR